MLFDLTDEQVEFRDAMRALVERRVPAGAVRAAWDDPEPLVTNLWSELAALGALGLVVPEEFGGAGASYIEQVLALEELGRAAAPGPVSETAVVAAVIGRYAGTEIQQRWLPGVSGGSALLSVSLGDQDLVTYGEVSDAVLVADGHVLHLVPAQSISWSAVSAQDPTRCLARAAFDLDASTVLTEDPEALQYANAAAYVGAAAQLVGCAQALLDMTVSYSMQREQFGKVIGSFQAIKHKLADSAVAIEAARSLTWAAAYALAHGTDDALAMCHAAKGAASAAGSQVNATALQVHGGIGFTWEHDLHLWLKRCAALERAHGASYEHREELGAKLIESRTTTSG
ncbi:Alkylation response protein AidB-like acyl-CoA dehydrogenase [Mycobacterium sp. smrl_JER01]|uniref:acyl-CoA dehydrogenase family protein n=1 Tax=Mycobacterium sp. smrl_JER01 TaxID=3402633 RepID=UPI003D74D5D7